MDTVERLMDSAELKMRRGGYHAVSFRDLAAELGIKSASVHYHFPKKEDLGKAVIERYAKRFFAALEGAEDPLAAYAAAFAAALDAGDTICLGGVLGAEAAGLPETMQQAVSDFFAANIGWLTEKLGDEDKAALSLSALEGALIVARSTGDRGHFDRVAAALEAA